jgi:Rhodopirellula transposase DDE domain
MADPKPHVCQCPDCLTGRDHADRELHRQMNLLASRLNEQQRRWFAALESKKLGHGGDTRVAQITGLHVDTIRRGREELDANLEGRPIDRIRNPGAGRPAVKKKDPEILEELQRLTEPVTGGDPMTEAKYVRRSLQHLSDELAAVGHVASPHTVADLLRDLDYRLRVNVKRLTGPYHQDRDRQFGYLESVVNVFRAEGWPILSVDTKKKELVGNFDQPGATWLREPYEVNAHDFLTDAQYRAVPYGLYDVLANQGHVVVGTSSDTPRFAAEAVARWWQCYGCVRYPDAGVLLVLADAGGSNGCRPRLWKQSLQELVANRYGLAVMVCHYPTGASKWNPVEHRLFGPISTNWAGVPLQSPDVLLGFVRGTTTRTGLKVTAEWWQRTYAKGQKVSDGNC